MISVFGRIEELDILGTKGMVLIGGTKEGVLFVGGFGMVPLVGAVTCRVELCAEIFEKLSLIAGGSLVLNVDCGVLLIFGKVEGLIVLGLEGGFVEIGEFFGSGV